MSSMGHMGGLHIATAGWDGGAAEVVCRNRVRDKSTRVEGVMI